MIPIEFYAYLEQVRIAHTPALFIPRQMITREDWDRAVAVDPKAETIS